MPLNHLVGRAFRVGTALLRGVQLCEPCQHIVDVTGIKVLLPTLIHLGGGHIAMGDTIIAAASDDTEA